VDYIIDWSVGADSCGLKVCGRVHILSSFAICQTGWLHEWKYDLSQVSNICAKKWSYITPNAITCTSKDFLDPFSYLKKMYSCYTKFQALSFSPIVFCWIQCDTLTLVLGKSPNSKPHKFSFMCRVKLEAMTFTKPKSHLFWFSFLLFPHTME
jgi:hypothetical protein